MYIETNGGRYPCTGAPALEGDTLRFCLPEGGPEALGDRVALCMEDGFVLREVDVSGYLRWGMEGDMLVITNLPVPEPTPGPGPEVLTTQEAMLDMLTELDYRTSLLELGIKEV